MRYERSSRIARHFASHKFRPFSAKQEFFNRHACSQQLCPTVPIFTGTGRRLRRLTVPSSERLRGSLHKRAPLQVRKAAKNLRFLNTSNWNVPLCSASDRNRPKALRKQQQCRQRSSQYHLLLLGPSTKVEKRSIRPPKTLAQKTQIQHRRRHYIYLARWTGARVLNLLCQDATLLVPE